jgi:hypothetical protein
MPDDWSPLDSVSRGRRPWFGPNRFGGGWHPRTWPGYLITTVIIVAIEAISVGTRAGWAVYLVAAIPLALFAVRTAARRLARRSAARRRS